MTIKASGRSVSILSVLILATGLCVYFAGPLPAAAAGCVRDLRFTAVGEQHRRAVGGAQHEHAMSG